MIRLPIFLIGLIGLIGLISLGLNFRFIAQNQENNTVVVVADGDTFQLKSKERVRLMGVDGPELERCAGPEAKKRLSELILNKTVELKESVKENYGRTMALVYADGKLVNKIMMEEGWGKPDYKKNSQRDILTTAYKEAQNKKVGLWSMCISNSTNLSNSTNQPCFIKGNIDFGTYEKFYHLPHCRHYNQIVLNTAYGENWFCTEKEALAAGFTRSASCDQ